MRKRNPQTFTKPENFYPWIYVDQYAIDTSRRNNSRWCMLARGTALTLRGSTRIEVTAEITRFNLDGYRFYYATPSLAAFKIIAFDDKKKIKPWRVRLSTHICPPQKVENRSPRAKRTRVEADGTLRVLNNRKTIKKKYAHVSKQGIAYGERRKSPGKFLRNTSERTRRWNGIKLPKGARVA